jgi:hypothetical protein
MTPYPPDQPEPGRPLDPRVVEEVRAYARIPASILILTGLLSLVLTTLGLIQLPHVPARMDQAIADMDANPQVPQDRKDLMREVFTNVKDAAQHPVAPYWYIAGIISSVLVVAGGWKLFNLSGTALPAVGSVLAMIPCTVGLCCLVGLPVGIWSLIVLNRPIVRAVIASNRSAGPTDPDAQYMR